MAQSPAEPTRPDDSGRVATSSAWAALSQITTMGLGGLAAIIVLLRFGKGADTDAVFAAYGVYGALLVMCLSLRTTVVARVVESSSEWAGFDRFLGAGLSLLALAALMLLALGEPLADLITGSLGPDAQDTAQSTLAILWAAVAAQLVAALGSAVLGIRGSFGYPGVAYAAGGVTAIAVLLGLSGPIGILAMPTGIASGSVLTAVLLMGRLVGLGYRPVAAQVWAGAAATRTAVLIVVASAAPVAVQLNYVVSAGSAASIGVGAVTLYTYAFFAAALVTGVTASAGSIVLAAPIAQTWDRRPESLEPHLRIVLRAGLLLIVPLLGVGALMGDEVVEVILGSSLADGDPERIVETFLALGGLMVATMAMQIPLLAAYAEGRYMAVAGLSLAAAALHAGATVLAQSSDEVVLLGAATSVGSIAAMALVVVLVHGRQTPAALRIIGAETAVALLVAAAAFGPFWLAAGAVGHGAADVAATALALVGYLLLLRALLPGHIDIVRRMVTPVTSRAG